MPSRSFVVLFAGNQSVLMMIMIDGIRLILLLVIDAMMTSLSMDHHHREMIPIHNRDHLVLLLLKTILFLDQEERPVGKGTMVVGIVLVVPAVANPPT